MGIIRSFDQTAYFAVKFSITAVNHVMSNSVGRLTRAGKAHFTVLFIQINIYQFFFLKKYGPT